ncbi:MAG: thiol-disulfide oxidoreductase DCC family protein [Gemmatimonadales bacterium]|nr:thiol-disulfide oxidoreductase DCC family protein [Gemmatimonadales bacterium]MBA3556774.1 thiol-disulfide oxidoreductase DCC family protein [Gemmatimonadales bacterium]
MIEGASGRAVVLFDGVCNLCNAWVRFVIDRDPRGRFVFAPLQGERAAALLREQGYRGAPLASIVLVENGRVYDRSTAVLRIARRLRGLWPVLGLLLAIPRPVRDVMYDWIGRRRYRWFGRQDQCAVPTPELRSRFLT